MALTFRMAIRTELLLVYAIMWVCMMTVFFETQIIPKYYIAIEHEMDLGKRSEPNDQGITTNKSANVPSVYKGPSHSEVLQWFSGSPGMVRLTNTSRKHPHLKSYEVQKEVCHRGAVHLLIYIQSAAQNHIKRNIIRETWGGVHNFKTMYVERVFLIAETDDTIVAGMVEDERKKNDDIILCHFKDSFKSLSLKAITFLDFVNNRCSHAKYILKADDDVFVNLYSLIEKYVPQMVNQTKTVVCQTRENSKAISDQNSNWFVPVEVLPVGSKGMLPKFCTGYAVLFSSDLIPLLLNESFTFPLVEVDDVYLFGLLMGKIKGVNFIDSSDTFTLDRKAGLTDYMAVNQPVKYVVVNAWEAGNGQQEQLFDAMLSKLSPFGKEIVNNNLLPFVY